MKGPSHKSGVQSSAAYSRARIAARVKALGREISCAYDGKRLDVVITLDRGFVFAADLAREISTSAVCHFVREQVRISVKTASRREVAFSQVPDLKGRDVLLVDAILESGVAQDFLLRRLGETQPRSLRLAVLLDKPEQRRVTLEPDYFAFRTASNGLWVGYGLSAFNGVGANLKGMFMKPRSTKRAQARGKK